MKNASCLLAQRLLTVTSAWMGQFSDAKLQGFFLTIKELPTSHRRLTHYMRYIGREQEILKKHRQKPKTNVSINRKQLVVHRHSSVNGLNKQKDSLHMV
jgi:hypothetical protein